MSHFILRSIHAAQQPWISKGDFYRHLARHIYRIGLTAILFAASLIPAQAAESLMVDHQKMRTHGLVELSYVDGHLTGINYPEHLQVDVNQPPHCALDQTTSHAQLRRSAWVWQSSRLLADPKAAAEFIRRSADVGISRLFVQVQPDLAGFPALFALAKAKNVSLFALGGEPEFVQNPAMALALVDQVLAYNALHADKFSGIQFDIEPHGLPAYRDDPERTLARYVELTAQINKRVDRQLSLGFVIPFWFDQKTVNGTNLLKALLPAVDELVLMSYRTTADAIVKITANSFCLAQHSRAKIYLAVELAPIADEQHFIFSEAQIEPYLIDDMLLAALRKTPPASVPYTQKYTVNGSDLSFFPQQKKALAMMRIDLPLSNFNGWFINGLDAMWLHE